jgi:hypothetical protein
MKKLFNYNWPNGVLLAIFLVLFAIDLGTGNIISALGDGFVAIFNMFIILVMNQRRIISKLEDNKSNKK